MFLRNVISYRAGVFAIGNQSQMHRSVHHQGEVRFRITGRSLEIVLHSSQISITHRSQIRCSTIRFRNRNLIFIFSKFISSLHNTIYNQVTVQTHHASEIYYNYIISEWFLSCQLQICFKLVFGVMFFLIQSRSMRIRRSNIRSMPVYRYKWNKFHKWYIQNWLEVMAQKSVPKPSSK